jgi:hypothetical protein
MVLAFSFDMVESKIGYDIIARAWEITATTCSLSVVSKVRQEFEFTEEFQTQVLWHIEDEILEETL